MAGLRQAFDEPFATPQQAFDVVVPAQTPGAIERGFRQATLSGDAAKLIWQSEEALRSGDTQSAIALRQQADDINRAASALNPNRREFSDFLSGGQASLSELPGYLGEMVGSGLHSASQITPAAVGGTALGLGASLATRGAISPKVGMQLGGMVGASVPGYNMNAEETMAQLANDPTIMRTTTPEERMNTARMTGAGMAALDLAPLGLVAGRLGSAFTREGLKNATLRGAMTDFAGGTATEALTGAGQAAMQQVAQQKLNPEHQFSTQDVINSAAAEAIGGAPMHGAQAGVNYAIGKPNSLLVEGYDKAKDFIGEHAPDALKTAVTGAKGVKDAAGAANDALKKGAAYVANVMDDYNAAREAGVNPLDAATGVAADIGAEAIDKLKTVVGDGAEDITKSAAELVKKYDKEGWHSPEAADLRTVLDAVSKRGAAGFDQVPAAVMASVKKQISNLNKALERRKKDPAAQTMEENEKSALDDVGYSRQGKKPMKDSVREAVYQSLIKLDNDIAKRNPNRPEAGIPSNLIENIASRVTSAALLRKGKPGVAKVLQEAVHDAVSALPDEQAQMFNVKAIKDALYEDVRKAAEPIIQRTFDEGGWGDSATAGIDSLVRPIVEGAYFEDGLSESELDNLTGSYSAVVAEMARTGSGKIGKTFVNRAVKAFGHDKAGAVIEQLQSVADMLFDGNPDKANNVSNALGGAHQISRLAGSFRSFIKPEVITKLEGRASKQGQAFSAVSLMDEMLSHMRDVYGRVGKDSGYEKADNTLRSMWSGVLKNPKDFDRVLTALLNYDKHSERMDSGTFGNYVRDNSGNVTHANIEALPDDDDGSDTDTVQGEDDTPVSISEDDRTEFVTRQQNETGRQEKKQAPLYHGAGFIDNQYAKEGVVQAPVSRHPSAEYAHGSEFSKAIDWVTKTTGNKLADIETMNVFTWADEEAGRTKGDFNELLNKAMDALIQHDKRRIERMRKSGNNMTQDAEFAEFRSKLAADYKQRYGNKAGEHFFGHSANAHYRYVRTSPTDDRTDTRYTLDKLQWFGPRDWEDADEYAKRVAFYSGAKVEDVENSMLSLDVKNGEKTREMFIDFPQLVAHNVNTHQANDVSGATTSLKETNYDRLGSEKDIKKALETNSDFRQGLLNAVHNVIGSLMLTQGVLKINTMQHGFVGTKSTEVRYSGLAPETVVWRDTENGRVITYGDLTRFKGVDAEGTAKFRSVLGAPLTEREVNMILPLSNMKLGSEVVRVNGESAVSNVIQNRAKEAAERGVAMRAVTDKNGKRRDLDMHKLMNLMMERYGLNPQEANHSDLVSNELAAFLLNEGLRFVEAQKYEVNLDTSSVIGENYMNVNLFKAYSESGSADPEGKTFNQREGRYSITYGKLKDTMSQMRDLDSLPKGDARRDIKRADTYRLKNAKATVKALEEEIKKLEKTMAGVRNRTEDNPSITATQNKRRDQLLDKKQKLEQLVKDMAWATGNPIEENGKVGDGQIDVSGQKHETSPASALLSNRNPESVVSRQSTIAQMTAGAQMYNGGKGVDINDALLKTSKEDLLKMSRENPALFKYVTELKADNRAATAAATGPRKSSPPGLRAQTGVVDIRGQDMSSSRNEGVIANVRQNPDTGLRGDRETGSVPTDAELGRITSLPFDVAGPTKPMSDPLGREDVKPTSMTSTSNHSLVAHQREVMEAARQAREWLKQANAMKSTRKGKAMAAAEIDAENAKAEAANNKALADKVEPVKVEKPAPKKTRAELLAEMNAAKNDDDTPFSRQGKGADNDPSSSDYTDLVADQIKTDVTAAFKKLLGDLFGIEISNKVYDKDGNEVSGKFDAKAEISQVFVELSAISMDVMNHEAWHAVKHLLTQLGPQGKEVVDTIERAMSTPMMEAWLKSKYANDEGVVSQLSSLEERSAFAFQLFMKGEKMPLPPKVKGWWQSIKDWVAKGLRKLNLGSTTDTQRTENFFKFVKDGGFLRDHKNPEAMLKALGKERGDNMKDTLKTVTKPLVEAVSTVFGHTANRLKKYKIEEFNQAVEMFTGKDGKSGFMSERMRNLHKWGNEAEKLVAAHKGKEPFASSDAFKAFAGSLGGYMAKSGMSIEEIDKVLSNITVYDTREIDANFEQFLTDLTNHGGLPEGVNARTVASSIADMGFSEGDTKLFANNEAIRRKWENKDPMDYMARLVMSAVTAAEKKRAFEPAGKPSLEQLKKAAYEKAPPDARELADKVFAALEGSLGGNMNGALKTFTQAMLTINNIRLLPFAVFSQMLEPMQLAFRSGNMGVAFDAMWRGVKEAPRTFEMFDKGAKRDKWEKLAEMSGSIGNGQMAESLASMYNGVPMKGIWGKINEKFFRYIFMNQWNRSMHIAATQAGVEYLVEHANNVMAGKGATDKDGGLRSARYLKELGVTAEDVLTAFGGKADLPDDEAFDLADKVERAVNQFVEEAMAHPDAGSNPVWANDQRFALIAHMKRFSFAHARYILDRFGNEIAHGNYGVLVPMVLAVPWMLAADWLKDAAKPGDESWKNNWNYTDYLIQGIDRAGMLGRGAIPVDAFKAEAYGGSAIEGIMGPTSELFGKLTRGAHENKLLDTLLQENPMARFST